MADPNKPLYDVTRADSAAPTPVAKPVQNLYGATSADAETTPSGLGKTPIGANYRIIALIGEGGMGKVFLAFDVNLKRHVALKRIGADHVSNDRLHQRFLTEAQASGKLDHFHIVKVFQLSSDADGPFIAMEYVPGPNRSRPDAWPADAPNPPLDLDEFIRSRGKLDVRAAIRIARKLLSAIGYAHKNQIIHRDIKPANILLTDTGEPKLADFGLARQTDLCDEGRTMAGAALLSLGYGAPEQENDASKADHRADLYALGATLWYLVTGQNPRFFRESEVPSPLRAIVVKALEKDRERRFQSAKEFDDALEKLAAPTTPQAPTPSSTDRGRCPKCQHAHFTDAQGFTSIKFCEQCGNSLQEPCLQCSQSNGIWSRFCSACGIDIAANTATTIQSCQAELRKIETQVKDGRFVDALTTLDRYARYSHPKLQGIAAEAKAIQPRIQNLFRAAREDRDQKIQTAHRLVANHEYQRAVDLLASVAAPLRDDKFASILQSADNTVDEMKQLRRAIKAHLDVPLYENSLSTAAVNATYQALARLNASEHRDLIGRLARMLVLIPRDTYYQQLAALAQKSAHREMERTWESVQTEDTVEAYEGFLNTYPDSPRLLEATSLLSEALREAVLKTPSRAEYRRRYLELRTADQERDDKVRAYLSVLAVYFLLGIIGGVGMGAIVGLIAGFSVSAGSGYLYSAGAGAVGGFLGGLLMAILRIRRS